jgi:hypothetical protein
LEAECFILKARAQFLPRHLLAEAVAEYRAMLELNPGDNQGVRYSLLPSLPELNRLEAARKLFEKYPEESEFNTVFAWGRVPHPAHWISASGFVSFRVFRGCDSGFGDKCSARARRLPPPNNARL